MSCWQATTSGPSTPRRPFQTGFSAAQEAASLLATERQQRPARGLPLDRQLNEISQGRTDDSAAARRMTALATPFTADGSVDEALLRKVVDRSIDGGVHGVVACGSTGEFSALTLDERRMVVETVVDQAAGRVPVIAQTGAPGTAEAIRLSRHAAVRGRRRDHAGGALLRAAVGRGDGDLPARSRRVRRHPGDDLQPPGGDRGRPLPRHGGRARPRGREHPLHQEHHDRHGPVRRADPQPRRRHLDVRRLGQPAARGPFRGGGRDHGGHGERRARPSSSPSTTRCGRATSRRPGGRGGGSTRSSARS